MQYEMRLAGLGGQGIILAGIIVAEAAGVVDGKVVTQTQSYGAEARGGFSRSDIIVSDEEILYPMASKLDLLLAMSQSAYEDNISLLKRGGVLVVDSTYVAEATGVQAYEIPFSQVAREKFGRENVANIIALGSLTQIFPAVSEKAMEKAVMRRVPKAYLEMNKKAFSEGIQLAKSARREDEEPFDTMIDEV
jgi:2-oxoglutarate ferredoxin oxidoreductase subunit gamma